MPVNHRFLQTDFGNGFATHNAILDVMPYEPEVLFIGTYNPDTSEESNRADFFYGRNYFWPAFLNLFKHGIMHLNNRRIPQRGGAPKELNPTLSDIILLCRDKKISFADFIKYTMCDSNYYINRNIVSYQNEYYDLIKDSHLAKLKQKKQIEWAVDNIITFIKEHKTIKTVYLTRQPTSIWKEPWRTICNIKYGSRNIDFKYLQSPSCRGRRTVGEGDMHFLLRKWLFSGSNEQGLDHNWLRKHGVSLEHFQKNLSNN